jgi:hypothetical protein
MIARRRPFNRKTWAGKETVAEQDKLISVLVHEWLPFPKFLEERNL